MVRQLPQKEFLDRTILVDSQWHGSSLLLNLLVYNFLVVARIVYDVIISSFLNTLSLRKRDKLTLKRYQSNLMEINYIYKSPFFKYSREVFKRWDKCLIYSGQLQRHAQGSMHCLPKRLTGWYSDGGRW